MLYCEACPSPAVTARRERQLKRWSADKKAALISGGLERL
jgi:predicted GIY-YIG superfamily endonuclease